MSTFPELHPLQIFRTIAYAAKDNVEMACVVDEMLRHCVVIPPGKLDLKENIDPPDHKPTEVCAGTSCTDEIPLNPFRTISSNF